MVAVTTVDSTACSERAVSCEGFEFSWSSASLGCLVSDVFCDFLFTSISSASSSESSSPNSFPNYADVNISFNIYRHVSENSIIDARFSRYLVNEVVIDVGSRRRGFFTVFLDLERNVVISKSLMVHDQK